MTDPTDEAVAAMTRSFTAKVKEHPMPLSPPWDPPGLAAAFFGCPTEDAMRVALDAIPTDVLARVVAGRPDKPTHTTPCPEWEPPEPGVCARCGGHIADHE